MVASCLCLFVLAGSSGSRRSEGRVGLLFLVGVEEKESRSRDEGHGCCCFFCGMCVGAMWECTCACLCVQVGGGGARGASGQSSGAAAEEGREHGGSDDDGDGGESCVDLCAYVYVHEYFIVD